MNVAQEKEDNQERKVFETELQRHNPNVNYDFSRWSVKDEYKNGYTESVYKGWRMGRRYEREARDHCNQERVA